MKFFQDLAGLLFVIATAILSIISVLGVWNFFSQDVITKSFETVGILAVVAIVIIIAGRIIGHGAALEAPNPMFKSIRYLTLAILIACVSALALFGVLAIWDVIADKDVLYKSLSSVAILAFGAFVIVMTCLEREDSALLKGESTQGGRAWTIGGGLTLLFVLYLLFSLSRFFW